MPVLIDWRPGRCATGFRARDGALGQCPGAATRADLRVAAVQVHSDNGRARENLDNAAGYVAQAASAGAQLILCPEFLATGYIFHRSIWDAGEPAGGLTERWLVDRAREHEVHIGASYLEAEGDEFFNTFTLVGPDGRVRGRVRKRSLPVFEGWYFRRSTGPRVIETELGRIGVGICNDNQTASFLTEMWEAAPDLILMPHSAPTPEPPLVSRLVCPPYDRMVARCAPAYAGALGVPVVMCNKFATQAVTSPIPLLPLGRVRWRFRGQSAIVDAAGSTLAELTDREGVLIADVRPGMRPAQPPKTHGYWSFRPEMGGRALGTLLTALEHLGQAAYGSSRIRKRKARALSSSS